MTRIASLKAQGPCLSLDLREFCGELGANPPGYFVDARDGGGACAWK